MSYDGTGGYEPGSDTSRERAEREAADGTLTRRLKQVHNLLRERGPLGATSTEVEGNLLIHHGQASSALTNLHKAGVIGRTSQRRNGSKVYKHLAYVYEGEHLEPYIPRDSAAVARVEVLEDRIARAKMALLTTLGSSQALKILEES